MNTITNIGGFYVLHFPSVGKGNSKNQQQIVLPIHSLLYFSLLNLSDKYDTRSYL